MESREASPTTSPGRRGFGASSLGYYALLVLVGLLGLALLGYLFFVGVGYMALPLLLALIFLVYLALVIPGSYVLTRVFNPTRRVLWVSNFVLLFVGLALGVLVGTLII